MRLVKYERANDVVVHRALVAIYRKWLLMMPKTTIMVPQ